MTLMKTAATVGTLAQGAVSTAVTVVKHPIGSASAAVGFAKGVAGAGITLVRGGQAEVEDRETSVSAPVEEVVPAQHDPRDDLPGPDLAHFEPPQADDLPEPVVIEADDSPSNGESGEPFHHEPKPASRDVGHADGGTDFEEAEGFVDEIPEDLRQE